MRGRLTIGEFGVMKGVITVQIEEFGDGVLWNAKAADGIPATKDFDFDIMNEVVLVRFPVALLRFPVAILGGVSLVSIPDTAEPLACRFLLQNADLADHAGETAAGEAATGETKEE